jgi:hypothetical protein
MSRNHGPAHEFKNACHLLLKRISKPTNDQVRTNFFFPEFDPDIGIDEQVKALQSTLDDFLSSRQEFKDGTNKDRKERVKSIVSQWYRSSYPFAVTILTISKETSAVSSSR